MSNNLSSVAEDLIFFGSEVLAQLQNNLKLVATVRRNYQGAEQAAGSTIQIPYIDVQGGATDRAIGDAVSASDVTSNFTSVTLGQVYQAAAIDNLQRTFQNVDLMMETASRISYNVAAKADAKVAALWNKIPNEGGKTDGGAMFNSSDDINILALAKKSLSNNQGPVDDEANLHAVINPYEAYALRTLDSYKRANWAGSANGRNTGGLNPTMGYQIHESQQIADATLSTSTNWGTPLVSSTGNIGDETLVIKGLQSTGTLKAGSTFALNGSNYCVTANVTASGGVATASIYPKLKAAAAVNDALTPVAHSAAGSMNFVYHSSSILFVARPLAAFAAGSGVTSVVVRDPQTQLGIRMSHQSTLLGNPGMVEAIVADIVCGTEVVRPEWAFKATGHIAA